MGNCSATPHQHTKNGDKSYINWPTPTQIATANIIYMDGKLQRFRQSIKASQVLSQNPGCFLCSSESMYVDSYLQHVSEDEDLKLGQIYFLMPLSKSQAPLTLQELCSLAIKASSALSSYKNSAMNGGKNSRDEILAGFYNLQKRRSLRTR